jgi:hypothetical protein
MIDFREAAPSGLNSPKDRHFLIGQVGSRFHLNELRLRTPPDFRGHARRQGRRLTD